MNDRWRAYLDRVPDAILEHEISRRQATETSGPAEGPARAGASGASLPPGNHQPRNPPQANPVRIDLPGVTVDRRLGLICYRGREHSVCGRPLQIAYALALSHRQGVARVSSSRLARMVYRGWDAHDAGPNVLVNLVYLRRAVPGLVHAQRRGSRPALYWLDTGDQREVVA